LADIFVLPVLSMHFMGYLIARRAGTKRSIKEVQAEFGSLQHWIFGLLLYIPSSFIHELGHWIAAHLLFEGSNQVIVMHRLMNGVNTAHGQEVVGLWLENIGLTLITATIIMKLAGYFFSVFYSVVLLVVGKAFLRRSAWGNIGIIASFIVAARSILVVGSMSLGSDSKLQDFSVVSNLLGSDSVWIMPGIYAAALIIPSLILWKIAGDKARERMGRDNPKLSKSDRPKRKRSGNMHRLLPWTLLWLRLFPSPDLSIQSHVSQSA
jgi:hypothetical protein